MRSLPFDIPKKSFFPPLLNGIEAELKTQGYKTVLNHFHDIDDIEEQISNLTSLGCDGIILLGTEMIREDFAPFAFLKCPIVLVDTYYQSVKMDCVVINNVDGAMQAFKARGYKIPEDIPIIGFDNSELSSYIDPPLTTVNVPNEYMGKLAAQRMITVLKEKEYHSIKIEVNTNLIVRKSVVAKY